MTIMTVTMMTKNQNRKTMATKERWTELFEDVVGRKPSPQEFMAGKETDFSPKEIRRIAGIEKDGGAVASAQEVTQAGDDAKEEFINDNVANQEFSASGLGSDLTHPKDLSEDDFDQSRQDAWISAFEKYVGRQPRPEEFLIGKAASFDLTSVNQFLNSTPKPVKPRMARWKKFAIAFASLLAIGLISAIIYGSHYYSREVVAERYLQVAGKDFNKQLEYEVWSDNKKPISNADLKYTNKSKVLSNTNKSDLMKDGNMVQVGREYLVFPKWKVAVKPAKAEISTNTKDLKISINDVDFKTSDSDKYSTTLERLYPGTYDFVASGKVNGQSLEVSSEKKFPLDTSASSSSSKESQKVTLNVKYLSFTLNSNLTDGDVYVGSKKIGTMKNGQYSASKLAVSDSASVYVQKKFSDGTSVKSETTSIEDISNGDSLNLDADGILDRDTADDLITAAYGKMQTYAVDNTTPDNLTDVFQGGTDNGMYKDLKDMIDTNTINAKNRKADSVTFNDVDVTSVTQTSAKSYTVNFNVVCDFYYAYDSDHKSSGDIKDKVSWSAKVDYQGSKSKSSSSDDYDDTYSSYSDYIITGKNGESQNISREDTVK